MGVLLGAGEEGWRVGGKSTHLGLPFSGLFVGLLQVLEGVEVLYYCLLYLLGLFLDLAGQRQIALRIVKLLEIVRLYAFADQLQLISREHPHRVFKFILLS